MDLTISNRLNDIISRFQLKGELVYYDTLKSGNINDTYTIVTDYGGSERQYLIQKINLNVFKEPMKVAENIEAVTKHIEQKLREADVRDIRRHVVKFYDLPDGSPYYFDEEGSCWRVQSFVFNSVTMDSADTPDLLRSVGTAFGRFQQLLSDFDASKLNVTIPDFHNTEKRYADLLSAAERDPCGRLAEVKEELEYLKSASYLAPLFRELHGQGKVKIRVTHNDTKCNNVLFDAGTKKHLAVVDLDTVMPGFTAHDFGDSVRFAANPAGEDADDPSKVYLDLDSYTYFAEGFIPPVCGMITDDEVKTLPDGVAVITFELACRFLTDYLEGDVYFKCKKEKHNLIRARAQIALLKDVIAKMPMMRERLYCIVNN